MKNNFSFNHKSHDLWKIYEDIKRFYPIGIDIVEKGIYFNYPGVIDLEKIIVENIHNEKNYHNKWVNFTDQIGKEINKRIIGTTLGQAPSFSAFIVMKHERIENYSFNKELHFSVSLIGNYYQIYGVDSCAVFEQSEKGGRYSTMNVLTISPFEEFNEVFEFVEKKIQKRFQNFKIVPYRFGQTIIKGLQVSHFDSENSTINTALFNGNLNLDHKIYLRGERYYGLEMWKKK